MFRWPAAAGVTDDRNDLAGVSDMVFPIPVLLSRDIGICVRLSTQLNLFDAKPEHIV